GVDGRAGYPSGRVGTAEPRARAQGDEAPAVLSRRAAPEARVTMPPPSRRPCPDDRATTILRGGAPSGAAGTEDVVSPGTWREGWRPTRRELLRTAGGMGAGLPLGGAASCAPDAGGAADAGTSRDPDSASSSPSAVPKRLLVLGGTGFIGPHMVRYAVERGH